MSEPGTTAAALKAAWAEIEASDLSLADKLSAYACASRAIVPNTIDAYDDMVARTAASEALAAAPQVGDLLPDFLCPDDKGRLVSLSSLLGDGMLVVSLNRGHWCPYCRLEVRALAHAAAEIEAAGARIVSIVPETRAFSQRMVADNELPFPVLTDMDLSFALSLGLVTPPGPLLQQIYMRGGIDLARFQGNPFGMLPSPATFVVDPSARIVARFIDPDFRRRMAIEDLLAAIRGAKPAASKP